MTDPDFVPLPPAVVPDVTWVTLDELKAQLYITHTADDAALTALSTQASTAILGYLKSHGDPTWTPPTVPADVKRAVLLLATYYWGPGGRGDVLQNPDDSVWPTIERLLARRRVPAMA
jgi:hypothetical protein